MHINLNFQLALQGRFHEFALWLPVPQETPHQRRLALDSSGNHAELALHHDPLHGATMLFVRWPGVQDDPRLTVSMQVETQAVDCDLTLARAEAPIPDAVRHYLVGSAHLPVNGAIRTHAEAITIGLTTPVDKLRAIYSWVLTHAQRRFDVAWCGLGDVPAMLAAGEFCGKCTDINSLLVALCRAAGLPARTVLGIRAAPSRFSPALGASGDVTQALHTRAEVYLGGIGWVPVDPADAMKLADEGVPESLRDEVSTYLLGGAEANWVAYNHARDFQLVPPATAGMRNLFTAPYAESAGKPLVIEVGAQGYSIFSRYAPEK
jgi:transglutaminase-like putative cysteine protease